MLRVESACRLLSVSFLILLTLFQPRLSGQSARFGLIHSMLPPQADTTYAVAVGDLDGDGFADAVIGNRRGQNRLIINDGTGVFRDATGQLPAILDATTSLALGDVDGDGDLDVLVGNNSTALVTQNQLYLNTGTGTFVNATSQLPGFSDLTECVALGDVDGDGDLDIVAGNTGLPGPGAGGFGGINRLHLNDGTGTFTDASNQLPGPAHAAYGLALGDVDGDGDLDILLGNGSGAGTVAQNRLLLNDGTGTFASATSSLPTVLDDTRAVALADVDGDGDLDALIGNLGQNIFSASARNNLLLNDGTGLFVDATNQLPVINDQTYALAVGDVDFDGDLDVLAGNQGQNTLLLNNGTGSYSDATGQLPATSDISYSVALADVDGDLDLDSLIGNGGFSAQQNRLLLNDSGGAFRDVTSPLPFRAEDTTSVALGDLDGDGDLDAYVGNSDFFGAQNRLLLNDGSGVFLDATGQLPAFLDGTFAVALGDVDADGDLDIMVGNAGGGPAISKQDRLYLNDGTGTFSDATSQMPVDTSVTAKTALGDVDGDGDLDAVLTGGGNRLLLNDGTGVFSTAAGQLPTSVMFSTASFALGDVDGDGDLDILLGNLIPPSTPLQNDLLLNDGAGNFTSATNQLPAIIDRTQAVALEDLNGDGAPDALIGNFETPNVLLLNNGLGTFVDASNQLPPILDSTVAIAMGDVDGDGDLDALMASAIGTLGGQNTLLLNDGMANFSDATSLLVSSSDETTSVSLGDLDGDGDLDALLGESADQNRLLVNLQRQVTWRAVPRYGKPLTLDLYGPGSEPWLLFASTGTSTLPVPGLGIVRLKLTTLLPLGGGMLDPFGQDSISFQIPQATGLLLTAYLQAVVGGAQPRVTNLEILAFTNL